MAWFVFAARAVAESVAVVAELLESAARLVVAGAAGCITEPVGAVVGIAGVVVGFVVAQLVSIAKLKEGIIKNKLNTFLI